MAIVLFKHQDNWSEALKVDERVISLFGKDLKIKQRWKADGKGGSSIGFGASVYPACILLTQYLALDECGRHFVKGKRVLELGGGVGLGGIGCVLSGAKEVVLTDGDGQLLDLIGDNANRNLHPKECRRLKIKRLLWDCADDIASLDANLCFDAIIASDIVACPYADAFAALLNTLIHFSNINASLKVIISYKRRQASESKFWVALRKDFDVIEVDSGQYPGEFKDSDSMGIVIASRRLPTTPS